MEATGYLALPEEGGREERERKGGRDDERAGSSFE